MHFPVRLYHKDEQVHRESGHEEYPIVIHNQEEYDVLAPGWHEDPVKAAAFGTDAFNEEDADDDELETDDVDAMLDEEEHGGTAPKKKSKKKKK